MSTEHAAAPPLAADSVRSSLRAVLAAVADDGRSGYALRDLSFHESVDATFARGEASFVFWARPAAPGASAYRTTRGLTLGYRGELPDKQAGSLMDAACQQIEAWERSLPAGALSQLFARRSAGALHPEAPLPPGFAELLANTTFTRIYDEWRTERERLLAGHFSDRAPRRASRILLVNATRGVQFFPSIIDFFASIKRLHPSLEVTSASYFEDIHELHAGVAERGLPVVPIAQVASWSSAAINRFDLVLFVGPCTLMSRFMALGGLTARLVYLDLAFLHQLIDSSPTWVPGNNLRPTPGLLAPRQEQTNPIVCYSCQPPQKVELDLRDMFALQRFDRRAFDYIPIGFRYANYYRTDRRVFDVALLASALRDYGHLDPRRLRGKRFLFLGSIENAPELAAMRGDLDLTVLPRLDEDAYARVLALCRCVVLPLKSIVLNVFLSVLDTVASGKVLIAPQHPGLQQLVQEGLPVVTYDRTAPDLARKLDSVLCDEARLRDIEARSIAFAKDKLDIYRILTTIADQQII